MVDDIREGVATMRIGRGRENVCRASTRTPFSLSLFLVPVATSVNRVYIPDRPINWLTEPWTRLALCNRGAARLFFPSSRVFSRGSGRQVAVQSTPPAPVISCVHLPPPAATKGTHREYYYPGAATANKRDRPPPRHLLTFSYRRLN